MFQRSRGVLLKEDIKKDKLEASRAADPELTKAVKSNVYLSNSTFFKKLHDRLQLTILPNLVVRKLYDEYTQDV